MSTDSPLYPELPKEGLKLEAMHLPEDKHPGHVLQESADFLPLAVMLPVQEHRLAAEPQHFLVFVRDSIDRAGNAAMYIWEKYVAKKAPGQTYPDVVGEVVAQGLDEQDWREIYSTLLRMHKSRGPDKVPLVVVGRIEEPYAFAAPGMNIQDFAHLKGDIKHFARQEHEKW